MDEKRKRMILDLYRREARHFTPGRVLCIPEPAPLREPFDLSAPPALEAPRVLRYHYEEGRLDGRPAWRIVCEGVTVETGFRG